MLVSYLNNIRQSNREALDAIDYFLTDSNASPPDTKSYKEYSRLYNARYKQVTDHLIPLICKAKDGPRYDHKNIILDIRKQYPKSSTYDIQEAFEEEGIAALRRVAIAESRRYLQVYRTPKAALEAGFVEVKLGTQEQEVDLKGQCFWVPASVRHEAPQAEQEGRARYSFFTYGGVNIQPRTNIIQGGNRPLTGNLVGSNLFNRSIVIKGFQDHHIVSNTNKVTKNHDAFALAGINYNSRVNKIYLPTHDYSHEERSIHRGRHTTSYSAKIAKRLDVVVEQGKAQGWGKEQYQAAVRSEISAVRQELKTGHIGLNKNHRSWATKW